MKKKSVLFQKYMLKSIRIAVVSVLIVGFGQQVYAEEPTESETLHYLSAMFSKYGQCTSTTSGLLVFSNYGQDFRKFGASDKYISISSSYNRDWLIGGVFDRVLTHNALDHFDMEEIKSISFKRKGKNGSNHEYNTCNTMLEIVCKPKSTCLSPSYRNVKPGDDQYMEMTRPDVDVDSFYHKQAYYSFDLTEEGEAKIIKAIVYLFKINGIDVDGLIFDENMF